jgi:2-succinyl-6-hydroxy-2,4-cyclohexadiene-1-carboxylate synthase
MQIDVDGLAYHVEIDEQVGNLKGCQPVSLLLLHGFTGSTRSWDALVPALTEHCRVIRVDLPGHGRTAHSDDLERHTLPSAAADLEAMLRALDTASAHVIGYSMGARLALYFGMHHPERVRALLLESGSPGLATEPERTARVASDEALAQRIERAGIEAFVRDWEALPLWRTQSDALKRAQRPGRLANRAAGLDLSLRGMGTGAQPSLWDALPALRIPTHCLVGEQDDKFVAIADAMCVRNPAIAVTRAANAGHAVHLEAPLAWTRWAAGALSEAN